MRPRYREWAQRGFVISIHAPLTGCDTGMRIIVKSGRDFNPRTPYGMRLITGVQKAFALYFNPRTPYGMRPQKMILKVTQQEFQSTHPLRDATWPSKGIESDSKDFNPRTPYGMRQKLAYLWLTDVLFQSTHPLRDATISCQHNQKDC